MIDSKDRSGYFGASDTDKIVGKWGSKTWDTWWLVKLGIARNDVQNKYTMCGTFLEHRILESLDIKDLELDKQVIIEDLLLRVNLDGNTNTAIYEVKTHNKGKDFKPPARYIKQVQVQMYATGIRKAYIVAYAVTEADYNNFFLPIDLARIKLIEVNYDECFISKTFLPKIKALSESLKKGVFPCSE